MKGIEVGWTPINRPANEGLKFGEVVSEPFVIDGDAYVVVKLDDKTFESIRVSALKEYDYIDKIEYKHKHNLAKENAALVDMRTT